MPTEPPRRKLLFHIGHHKTGSTTIQYAFATGRVTLVGGRILYPGRMAHNYLRPHFDAYAREGRVLPGKPGFPGLATISELLRRGDYDVAVISGEEFEGAEPSAVKKVLAEFMLPHVTDHAVICYIRPHAARVLSSFAERVKLGFLSGLPETFHEEAVRDSRFKYAQKMTAWAEVFGENLRLRPMIRAELAGGDVLRDFVETGLGPGANVEIAPVPLANESLSLEDLVLVALVQGHLMARGRPMRHAMGWELAATVAADTRSGAPGTKVMLHKALAERIRTAYRADAEALDKRFFGGRNLFRDELDRAVDEALPAPQSFDPADHFSANALRALSVLSTEINRLLDHEAGPWHEFLLNRRIATLHGEADGAPLRKADQPPQKPLRR